MELPFPEKQVLFQCDSVQVRPPSHFARTPVGRIVSTGELKTASAERVDHFITVMQENPAEMDTFLSMFDAVECLQLVNTRLEEENFQGSYSFGTPLAYAISQNNASLVKSLLKFGADSKMRPCTITSPPASATESIVNHLHFALLNYTDPDIVKGLLQAGELPKSAHLAVLEYAARCSDPKLAVSLLNGVDVNMTGDFNRTGLHLAVTANNGEMVDTLLKLGADGNQVDKQGKTPLMYAAEKGSTTLAQKLMKVGGSNVNKTDAQGKTALHLAVKTLNVKLVEFLLNQGANVSLKNASGLTPVDQLFAGSCKGRGKQDNAMQNSEAKGKIAELLLQNTTSLEMSDKQFVKIAFLLLSHTSCDGKSLDIIRRLLEANKTLLKVKDESDQSLLHVAAGSGCDVIVSVLIKEGLDVTALDHAGWQPVHHASVSGNLRCIHQLVEAGADVNAVTPCDWSPVWLLLRHGHQSTALQLIKGGCDTTAVMKLSILRQMDSSVSLPLSLYDPAEKTTAMEQARQGRRRKLTVVEYAQEMGWKDVVEAAIKPSQSPVDELSLTVPRTAGPLVLTNSTAVNNF